MAQPRRYGDERSEIGTRFVDAAETILAETGGHAVSARTVAEMAGLKPQLLYYYFRGMDDLLRAVVRRVNERRAHRFEIALASPQPLRALWELSCDPGASALAAELSVMATRRAAIRDEIVEAAAAFRIRQTEAVARLLGDAEADADGLVMIAAALSRMLVAESALGLTVGHAHARAIADELIDRYEGTAPALPRTADMR